MNWHEVIEYIQGREEYRELVSQAYLSSDLQKNVIDFEASEEFSETVALIRSYLPNARKLLDAGAGNGIASGAFARIGFEVTALEPDTSTLVGCGAIAYLNQKFGLSVGIVNTPAEHLPEDLYESFDVVYARQCMHHAADLNVFVERLAKCLKPGGLFITVRDHCVFDEQDKLNFLKSHPLHQFYGGENAYTREAYEGALAKAGLEIKERLGHFDSVINYAPMTRAERHSLPAGLKNKFRKIVGPLADSRWFQKVILAVMKAAGKPVYDEKVVAGRHVAYIAQKPMK